MGFKNIIYYIPIFGLVASKTKAVKLNPFKSRQI